jgi:hypothetical protein
MSTIPITELSDEQFLTEIGGIVDRRVGTLRTEFEGQLRGIKQRLSRPPGSTLPDPSGRETSQPLLASNSEFVTWIKSNPGRKSFFKAELPLQLGRKAVTPISGLTTVTQYPLLLGPQQPRLRLISLIPSVPITTGAAIWTREKTFTPGAAVVPETTLKPPTTIVFESITSTVQTIASILKVSVQALNDQLELTGWLDMRLNYAVQLELETLLLTAPAPNGILASGTPPDPAFTPTAPATQLDVLAGAIAQLESNGYQVDAIVLSAADAFKMRLLKSTMGTYLWADPDAAVASSTLWNTPVIISPKMPAGQFAVGGFGESCLYFDRQNAVVEISFENEDDFVRNLATMRCECRGVLSIPTPQGLVVGTFTGTTMAAHPANAAKK